MDETQEQLSRQTEGRQDRPGTRPQDADLWLAALVNSSDDAIISKTLDGVITSWNPAAQRLYGYSAEEIVGKSISLLIPADRLDEFDEIMRRLRQGEWVDHLETVRVRRDGTHIDVSITISPIVDARGQIIGASTIARDITEHKLAEQERQQLVAELDRSRRLFQHIAETSPDAIYVYDLDSGRHLYVSARGEQVIGYTAEEVMALGDRFAVALFHPEDLPSLPERRRKLWGLADDEIYETEYRLLQPDGTYRWLSTRTSVFARTAEAQVRQIVSVTQDVTARKHAEERLAYHALLLENVHEAIVAADERLILTAWNRAAEEMYGWTADEVLGRDIREVVRSEFDPEQRAAGYQVLAETGFYRAEAVHHRKDGTPIQIEGSIMTLRDAAERVIGYVYVYRDITERKWAEEVLRASEERFRSYFELGLIGMAITSPTKGNLEVNDEICAILGYERSELLRMTWAEMTHPDDLAVDLAHFNRVLAGEIDGYSLDKRWIRKDGQIIYTTISVKCLRRRDGSVDYFVALLQDITTRKQVGEELRRAHDKLELRVAERTQQLIATNEELRKEIIERKRAEQTRQQLFQQLVGAQEEERRRIAHELHDSLGQHLTTLHLGLKAVQAQDGCPDSVAHEIQQLRDLALRIDDQIDRLTFELRPPSLDDLGLQAALRLLVKEWSATGHTPVDVHIGQLDHRRLPPTIETTVYRIVQEALTNILKHSGATRVSLIVKRQNGEVLAIIEDDGRGFDLEAATYAPGTGQQFGIEGMRERVALAGGRLDIETTPGSGTTVYVHIPLPADGDDGGSAADD